jgi:hypothetical protein
MTKISITRDSFIYILNMKYIHVNETPTYTYDARKEIKTHLYCRVAAQEYIHPSKLFATN